MTGLKSHLKTFMRTKFCNQENRFSINYSNNNSSSSSSSNSSSSSSSSNNNNNSVVFINVLD
jgi:hypothetical protein